MSTDREIYDFSRAIRGLHFKTFFRNFFLYSIQISGTTTLRNFAVRFDGADGMLKKMVLKILQIVYGRKHHTSVCLKTSLSYMSAGYIKCFDFSVTNKVN